MNTKEEVLSLFYQYIGLLEIHGDQAADYVKARAIHIALNYAAPDIKQIVETEKANVMLYSAGKLVEGTDEAVKTGKEVASVVIQALIMALLKM
jgi:hypothetical protein